MTSKIQSLRGQEILDSRGRPTVKATCQLASGAIGSASVPSGASTGAAEAHELRDGDPARYQGMGCRRAAENIAGEIQRRLAGTTFTGQEELDRALVELDGAADKSRLGANAILAVSLAYSRAAAAETGLSLYAHFARQAGLPISRLPRLTINLFSGGKHAGGQVPIQDVLIVPASPRTIDDCLVMGSAVYHAAVELCRRRFQMRWLVADEGGLAPPVRHAEELFDCAMEAIEAADLQPGRDVFLAVDLAASHFFHNGLYHLGDQPLSSDKLVDRVAGWIDEYPIVSLEDALAEDDWPHWPILRAAMPPRVLVLGDDLLCTNPARIQRAIAADVCSALLLKVNQIGTLTEAWQALQLARSAGWQITASVRSGDTEDDWFSDLAVGWSADQSKIGSLTRSERLAKYNRLLEIERELGLAVNCWPGKDAQTRKGE